MYVNGDSLGGNAIVSITSSGGVALVRTADVHGIVGEPQIVISGASNASYNQEWAMTQNDTVSFFITDYLGDSTGGTWALA